MDEKFRKILNNQNLWNTGDMLESKEKFKYNNVEYPCFKVIFNNNRIEIFSYNFDENDNMIPQNIILFKDDIKAIFMKMIELGDLKIGLIDEE